MGLHKDIKQRPLLFYLVTDSKDSYLLETNLGERAKITPVDKMAGGDARVNLIKPYFQQAYPSHDVFHLTCYDGVGETLGQYLSCNSLKAEKNYIFLPGMANYDTGIMVYRYQRENPNLTVVNGNPLFQSLFAHKGILNDIAALTPQAVVPVTKDYATPYYTQPDLLEKTIKDAERTFAGIDYVVIKPANAYAGKGLIITPGSSLRETLEYLLRDQKKNGRQNRFEQEKYWLENRIKVMQVQQFIRSKPFDYKEHQWDGTKRFLWTGTIEANKTGVLQIKLKAHAGFQKLPLYPLDASGHISHHNSISASYSHSFKEKFQRTVAGRFLSPIFTGHTIGADCVMIDHENDHDVPVLAQTLEHIIQTAIYMPSKELEALLKRNDSWDGQTQNVVRAQQAIKEKTAQAGASIIKTNKSRTHAASDSRIIKSNFTP